MGKTKHPAKAYQDAIEVIQTLEEGGFHARLAGGCVRDRLLHVEPADYDVATNATPGEVCSLFEQKNRKVVPTGVEHGTVTIVMPAGPIEITSLRKDVATDGRRATVIFGTSFEEDAARRDFTINAMFEDKDGKIYDFFSGVEHLKRGELRFVGDPRVRIQEDYLRILRYFRFWARLKFRSDPAALEAITELKDGLAIISQERITQEILQLLNCEAALEPLEAMFQTSVMSKVMPEAQTPDAKIFQSLAFVPPPHRGMARLAMLVAEKLDKKALKEFGGRLRISNQQKKELVILARGAAELAATDPDALDQADVLEQFDQWEEDCGNGMSLSALLPSWGKLYPTWSTRVTRLITMETKTRMLRKAPLPVTGADLISHCKLSAGPDLGRLMEQLKRDFRNGRARTKSDLLKIARGHLKGGKGPP